MFTPSTDIILLLNSFSCCFSAPALLKVITLVCGTILTPGRRTVASALRAIGLQTDKTFGRYHRLLSRDKWSALYASKQLLLLLLNDFIPQDKPIDIVVDETLERRRGKNIAYKGWFRDAVLSSQSRVVTTLGIRWLCACVLVSVPWSDRHWALPFLTFPSLSQKICAKLKRPFCGTTELTSDVLTKVRKWVGTERAVRLIADGGFSHIKLLHFAKSLDITHIGRLQINAGLYDEPGEQPSNKRGPKPTKGDRQQELKQYLEDPETEWKSVELPIYEGKTRSIQYISGVSLWYVKGNAPILLRWVLIPPSQEKDQPSAFFSTDINMKPEEILSLYADRWNIEVFFEEVRACMGYETQRGWTNRTIGRTTPCLFGVFSLVVLLAKRLFPNELPIRQAAWYTKKHATFRDVLAAVREHLWENGFAGFEHKITQNNKGESPFDAEYRLIPAHLFVAMQEMACYAA